MVGEMAVLDSEVDQIAAWQIATFLNHSQLKNKSPKNHRKSSQVGQSR
jgi:hypothetical protein